MRAEEKDEFECEQCKMKIKGIEEFCDHLEAHKLEMRDSTNPMNSREAHQ